MADEVIVMKEGQVVERGSTEDVFADPKHPYTQALMAAAFAGTLDHDAVRAVAQ
jgi:ABC-type antimicrobial peptide transport system ATPase subunit